MPARALQKSTSDCLARAENALLEERLDEAAVAIDTASKAGVEAGASRFLTAQLAKARRTAQSPPVRAGEKTRQPMGAPRRSRSASAALAVQRMDEGHLIEPEKR